MPRAINNMAATRQTLHTYTHSAQAQAQVYAPRTIDELSELLLKLNTTHQAVSLMGGRNSFGDVFLPAQEAVLDISSLPKSIFIDKAAGTVKASAGVTSSALMQALSAQQLYLPSQTGSPLNTLAGDISANVNGKDSWRCGNFYHRVISLELMKADGTIITVSKANAEVLNAVVGGLGLCGIILSAVLKAEPAELPQLNCVTIVTANLHQTFEYMASINESQTEFAYASVDSLAPGKHFGRGVVETATWCSAVDRATVTPAAPLNFEKVMGVKDDAFWWMMRQVWQGGQKLHVDRAMWRTFNALRYAWLKRKGENKYTLPFVRYQYPIVSRFPNWYKGFLPRGMQELQCLFSFQQFETAFNDLVQCCYRHGAYSELCAIRRHIPDDGFLSFSGNGLSVTINYDRNHRTDAQLYALERDLIQTVIKHGGKVYLAKFPYITPDEVRAMYPQFNHFVQVKQQLDPQGLFSSAAWQRWMG